MVRREWSAMIRSVGGIGLGFAAMFAGAPSRADSPDFRRDVAPILSRAGCNQGACHGNQNGKGGFKLSLRGEDPDLDFAALTRDGLGRRTDPIRPAQSLVLLKATGAMSHEGGRRFDPESLEYRSLHDWIAAGCPVSHPGSQVTRLSVTPTGQVVVEPNDTLALKVEATFADGSKRDVTRLAVLEPTAAEVATVSADGVVRRRQFGETVVQVRYVTAQTAARVAFVPARPDYHWPGLAERNVVDKHVFAKLRALRIRPAPVADDGTFLRRVYLDTLGVVPTVDETRAFLADTDPDKRAKLIDRLLDRPEFADLWALVWSDLLRNEEKVLDAKGTRVFHDWIRDQFAANVPLNDLARTVIAGRGSTYSDPPANYYRALRDPYSRGEATAQVFLGVRVQCARCHNHPFDRWTQTDYHEWSAFFSRVQYRLLENGRKDKFDQHEFVGEQVVWMDRSGELADPRTGRPVPPKFLGEEKPAQITADSDRLQLLADWVANPANPFFARAQVNRIWFHLFGRGLVEPNDDFRTANPPANPELLDALAAEFVAHKFDLKHLVRLILNSQTYQLLAETDDTNRDDVANFSHAQIAPLKAEVLLDAFGRVLEAPVKFDGFPVGTRAGQLPDAQVGTRGVLPGGGPRFLKAFGKPDRLLSSECERGCDTTLVQAFQLITGGPLHEMLARPDNRLGRLIKARATDGAIVEEVYLAALCRPPSDRERAAALAVIASSKDRRSGLEDVAWGVLNAKAFLLRR
jgi:hypothetical protein